MRNTFFMVVATVFATTEAIQFNRANPEYIEFTNDFAEVDSHAEAGIFEHKNKREIKKDLANIKAKKTMETLGKGQGASQRLNDKLFAAKNEEVAPINA